ncbi:uncharacterized protein LOC121915495 [Sceloporus undulatus]|uniref:uncharacterized protein LOC121915495 n=1 Tax=Sceloporus undulatus TaxID=8520 RepID=UPI001C4B1E58|nr:uncharacterized protein LOC121915495 [Sceloporus undulatus]
MVRPNLWILPTQGILLLWLALHPGTWSPGISAELNGILGPALLSNSSGNRTELVVPLTCQSFQCSGERCYQEVAHGNSSAWEPCHNASHCELFRLNSTSYTAGCSSDCGNGSTSTERCMTNSSMRMELCIMECCDSPNCLRLNATAYGDLPSPTTPAATTTTTVATTTATTTTVAPRNGKVCGHFTCHGEGCYRGQKSSMSCSVGFDFCEMKKTGPHFVAGCSKACNRSGPACAAGSKAPCFQECCPARPKASCLRLDGGVHFNGAGRASIVSLVPLLAYAGAILSLTYALLFSVGPN